MTTEASPIEINHLANEKSPYLLEHAHNPVDWYPWGAEAFAKARKEQKPIFLSIGYSTCHWCHVMEHESFENKDIARLLNANFISIKVDREERPDVDRVYMSFVQATTGSGGWPMSVFLTPELEPFVGGTYFPPTDRFGRPGFATILKQIAGIWKTDRQRILEQGSQITASLRQYAAASSGEGSMAGKETLDAGFKQIARGFDPEWGGFSDAPKFPRPVTLNFLFRVFARDRKAGGAEARGKQALEMNLLTLRKMAEGGMHDHLGGGFHRYSVDGYWHIPHFEKMLYDQAQLAASYLDAFQITRDPLYEGVARDILDYVRRDMTGKEGGFYSAEDADSLFERGKPERGEGAFYLWTQDEIQRALGDEPAKIFDYFYGVEPGGNAPAESDPHGEFSGKNTLIQRYTLPETATHFSRTEEDIQKSLAQSRKALFEVRAGRPRPNLDDKVITAWNGLMISAFARASQVLDDPGYLEAGRRAALFVEAHLYDKGTLLRSYREGPGKAAGFADDYAFLIQGLLDLYEASFEIKWLQWAVQLQKKQDELFQDKGAGGYFGVTGEDPNILLRMKEDYDGAEPSPNSVSALNLLRLAQLTGNAGYEGEAKKTIAAFGEQLHKMPAAMPQMLVALDFALDKPLQIVIAGGTAAGDTRALLREVHRHYIPDKILLGADGGEGQKWLAERLDFMKTAGSPGGKAAAYLCEDYTCQLPTSDPVKLSELLGAQR